MQNIEQSTWKSRYILNVLAPSPKLSSLFVLKKLKRGAEVIKDFDKDFALYMCDILIATSVHFMNFLTHRKVLARVHSFYISIFIHAARKIIYGDNI
jgi:hypothetical protein